MVATAVGEECIIAALKRKLEHGHLSLPQKYRVLCSLRNCSNSSAQDALLLALNDKSALFRHDVAFALGQRQNAGAIQALKAVVADAAEHCMVRHEAAEALGAIGTPECVQPVLKHANDSTPEVAETCALALQRIEYLARQGDAQEHSSYQSVDPTPPFPSSVPESELSRTLNDEDVALFDRYRALFALRNRGGREAVAAMAECLQRSSSVLLKHEVAYVLGQLLDQAGIACLKRALEVCRPFMQRSRRRVQHCLLEKPFAWYIVSLHWHFSALCHRHIYNFALCSSAAKLTGVTSPCAAGPHRARDGAP